MWWTVHGTESGPPGPQPGEQLAGLGGSHETTREKCSVLPDRRAVSQSLWSCHEGKDMPGVRSQRPAGQLVAAAPTPMDLRVGEGPAPKKSWPTCLLLTP